MHNFKFLFLSLLLFTLLASCNSQQQASDKSQETTTFILVRHAEKADDGTNDPPLNETGKERAKALADHLKETNITAIYSTDYKQTRQTVQQIADTKGFEIKMYDPFVDSVMVNMLETEAGGTVLKLTF